MCICNCVFHQLCPCLTEDFSSSLQGVDICGETTLIVTKEAQQYNWEDYAFTLDIPNNALPSDLDECTLHIKASVSGDYQFPDGLQPVSPIFWIRCEPHCKFKKEITMGLQHCARVKNLSKLRFVKASCAQKERPLVFTALPEGTGDFTKSSLKSLAHIQVRGFSGRGVAQEGSDELCYTAKLYYYPKGVENCKVHFTVTLDTPGHRKVSFYIVK